MVLARCTVATLLAAGLSAAALGLLDRELVGALRADGAREWRVGWELVRAARPQVLAAAAGFGRAISDVSASLMVGGNIPNQIRILITASAPETGRSDFALGLILLALALLVN